MRPAVSGVIAVWKRQQPDLHADLWAVLRYAARRVQLPQVDHELCTAVGVHDLQASRPLLERLLHLRDQHRQRVGTRVDASDASLRAHELALEDDITCQQRVVGERAAGGASVGGIAAGAGRSVQRHRVSLDSRPFFYPVPNGRSRPSLARAFTRARFHRKGLHNPILVRVLGVSI
jgi:hypothetical protein